MGLITDIDQQQTFGFRNNLVNLGVVEKAIKAKN